MKLSGNDIVCVGFNDWDNDVWTNQHHLMYRLARTNRVLFVESLGLRRPSLAGRDLRRIARRVRRGLGPPREVDGLSVLSPLVLPLHGLAPARALNARLLPRLVARGARRLGMRTPVLWAYVPQAEVLIEPLEPRAVIYHCVDDIAAQKGIDAASFRASEERFAQRADLVIASSPALAERMRELSDNVLYAPNVADHELFASALEPGDVDPELAALPEPRIVFTGAVVRTKLDFELLVELARLRRDWTFALVGPVGPGAPDTDVSPLEREPNLHLLGPRAYSELPAVLRGAAAGLIPYLLNELTASIFPMKVYEYLGAGLPVVATPLPALADVPEVVTVEGAPATAARLDELLRDDSADTREERSGAAAAHSWDARIDELAAAMASL